jgi:hypothetical protein
VLGKYKQFVVKMHIDAPKNKLVRENLDLLCDLELVFSLSCILPMLEVVHTLIKYAQKQDVFICEFIDGVKSTEAKLHWLYVDPFCKFDDYACNEFTIVCEHRSELLPLIWVSHEFDVFLYLLPYLVFNITGHNYKLHHLGGSYGAYVHVNMNDQFSMIESMKVACSKAAMTLCVELSCRFPDVEIMSALGIVYPQYWLCEKKCYQKLPPTFG